MATLARDAQRLRPSRPESYVAVIRAKTTQGPAVQKRCKRQRLTDIALPVRPFHGERDRGGAHGLGLGRLDRESQVTAL